MKPWSILPFVCGVFFFASCGEGIPSAIPPLPQLSQTAGIAPAQSDEEQIARVLDDVHQGMEAQQIFKVLAHVSRNYRDAEGRDYKAIEAYLNHIFKKYRTIRITRVVPRILVQGSQARAVETFGTVAEPQNPAAEPPVNVQGQVTVSLEKSSGQWLITEWSSLL